MSAFFKPLFLTLLYGIIGVWVAFPLSYFFQDGLYSNISFYDYVAGGRQSIWIGAQFGSVQVYKYTAYACIALSIFIGKLIEWRRSQRKK